MTSKPQHLLFLDGMRGLAILAVFLYHSLGSAFGFDHLPWNGLFPDFAVSRSFWALFPLTYGWVGVAIFFVISGFCIHLSHVRSTQRGFRLFFVRRFFRIYPPYLCAVFLFFFFRPWGTFSIDSFPRLIQLATHVFLIHNFDQRTFFGINGVFWTIAVEAQLYLIYPLLLVCVNRLGWGRTLTLAAILEVGIHSAGAIYDGATGAHLPIWLTYSPFAYWLSWSVGAYLADCYHRGLRIPLANWPLIPLILAALGVDFFRPAATSFGFILWALSTAVVIARFLSGAWSVPQGSLTSILWRHLSFLGLVSYSVYLLHQPFLNLVSGALRGFHPDFHIHPLGIFTVCLAAYLPILMVSYIYYRWLELPSIALGKKYIGSPGFSGQGK